MDRIKQYPVKLDFIRSVQYKPINLVQFDAKGADIVMTLTSNKIDVDLTNCTVTMEVLKSDKTINVTGLTGITDNIVKFTPDINDVACVGKCIMTLTVYKDDGKTTSIQFFYTVTASLVQDDSVTSQTSYPVLDALIASTIILNNTMQDQSNTTASEVVAAREGEIDLATKIGKLDASLAQIMQEVIPVSSAGIKGDNVTDDQPLLNTLLNTNNDTAIDLNVGRCNLNTTLNVTKPNTSIEGHAVGSGQPGAYRRSVLSANHVNAILNVDIPNSENGVDIRKITLDGNDMATVGLNYADYSNGRNLLEDVNVVNVNGVALQYNGDDYATRVNRFYSRYCKKGLIINGVGHYNIIFENCRFLVDQCLEIGLFASTTTMKQIIFRGCDFECPDVLAGNVQNWLKLGGGNEIVFEDCYFENSPIGLKANSMIQLGTDTLFLNQVSFIRCHFAPSPNSCDFIFDWKNVGTCIIDACFFEAVGVKGIIDASSSAVYTKFAYPLSYWFNTPIPNVNTVIATDDGTNTPRKMEELFCIVTGKTSYPQPTFRKSIAVQPDATGIMFTGKDQDSATYPYEYTRISKGGFFIGDGTTTPDVAFVRYSPKIGGVSNGQSFKVDGTWNGGHFIMGGWHLWIDATGKLRILGSVPTGDLVGTVVGAQS